MFRTSNTVFTLKELEKAVPSATGINGMQVKDYIQALVDENMVRVEKIGSGNWYWSFASNEKKAKQDTLDQLKKEKDALETRVTKLREEVRSREESEDERRQHQEWQSKYDDINTEVAGFREELKGYEGNDPAAFELKKKEAQKAQGSTERWTDNILILDQWFLELSGGDRGAREEMREQLFGDQYAKDEGLIEY